ncbi:MULTISPECIES: hypothetical protein [unclassified Desulfovibrio]|uniref:hypothetical protein n=1 Tax=unclassified Desulfovibrio TaxID=2593640 RepID=UPI000F5F231B|nr:MULTISPECIES: hypothetical protein [unclassified Desulfovibrio]RRD69357.1 hypothetical protein EII24_10460 [Desulfovibrio sp. OH1209_COT-279]RRD86064.1 hypothetical protein EII23_10460 [Desulfovibrio sp. OH1186_COT-070]
MPSRVGFLRLSGNFFARVVRWLFAAVFCLGIFSLAVQALALAASALALLILVTCLVAVCFPAESREVWQWARDVLAPSGKAGEGSAPAEQPGAPARSSASPPDSPS